MADKPARDIEKNYPLPDFIDKCGGLPARATFNIEHERGEHEEEIEFQTKWSAK